ncbi:MAG: aldo/keto reductase, partial [Polaromonas sp.]|nr:aldo/keto reductase [Polaromonas sp.]
RTLAHLQAVYGALDLVLDAQDEAFIDTLVVPGHASSAGFNDPSYPFFGRPV